jgi:hypothetical protein
MEELVTRAPGKSVSAGSLLRSTHDYSSHCPSDGTPPSLTDYSKRYKRYYYCNDALGFNSWDIPPKAGLDPEGSLTGGS